MNVVKQSATHIYKNVFPPKTSPAHTADSTSKRPIPPPLVIKRHELSNSREAELRGQQTDSFIVPNLPTHYSQVNVVESKASIIPEEPNTPTLQKMVPESTATALDDETLAESAPFEDTPPSPETDQLEEKCSDQQKDTEVEGDETPSMAKEEEVKEEDSANETDAKIEGHSVVEDTTSDTQQTSTNDDDDDDVPGKSETQQPVPVSTDDPKSQEPVPPDITPDASDAPKPPPTSTEEPIPGKKKPLIPDAQKPKLAGTEEPTRKRQKPVPPTKKPSIKFSKNTLVNGTALPTKPLQLPSVPPDADSKHSLDRDKENHVLASQQLDDSTTENCDKGDMEEENVTASYTPKMHTKLAKLTQLPSSSSSKSQTDDERKLGKSKSFSSTPQMTVVAKKTATLPHNTKPLDSITESQPPKPTELMKKLQERRHKLEKQLSSDLPRTSAGARGSSDKEEDLSQFGIVEQGDTFIV